MTEANGKWLREQPRFNGIFDKKHYPNGRFDKTVLLSSVPKYDECREYIEQAYEADFDGTQAEKFEEELAKFMRLDYALATNSGEAALHLALKLAAEKLYGSTTGLLTLGGTEPGGCLYGKKVFCSDFTTADMVNPIVFEGGSPVFIDCGETDWSMDPAVLELAFQKHPDVKIVVMNHVYGFPGDIMGIRKLCFEHDALLIECAGEAFGAAYRVGENGESSVWAKAGALGDYCVLDFGRGKIIGCSDGGALLTRDCYSYEKAKYWATGAQVAAPWEQHEELGYRYAMGDLEAAMLRGQLLHIDEIIEKKKAIYDRYCEKLDGSLAYIISTRENTKPNYWLTTMTCESSIRFHETRNDRHYTYTDQHGTAAPMEIHDALRAFGAECSPVHKPMSMQPIYRNHAHFTLDGEWRSYEYFSNDNYWLRCDRARQYYESGVVLPSDAGMTGEEQERIIEITLACFDRSDLERMMWK